jgi:hypothetical protein
VTPASIISISGQEDLSALKVFSSPSVGILILKTGNSLALINVRKSSYISELLASKSLTGTVTERNPVSFISIICHTSERDEVLYVKLKVLIFDPPLMQIKLLQSL